MLNNKIALIVFASIGTLALIFALYKFRTSHSALSSSNESKSPVSSDNDPNEPYIGNFTISMESYKSQIVIDSKTETSETRWRVTLHFKSRFKTRESSFTCQEATGAASFITDEKLKPYSILPFQSRSEESIDFGIHDIRRVAFITDNEKCSLTFKFV